MTRRKLIEVALPLEAINVASAREKSIRHGHPSTLHLWWARRPLATARAVIFAQMVDDPSSWPDLFPTEKAQQTERQRLFKIIEELVQWENTTNEEVLERARSEMWASWRRTCADNADHPRAAELFDRNKLPGFHDPFAGGGSLPLEAQRLGLEAWASDLNPVAVLINKAMIEIPPRFAGRPPVNPEWQRKSEGERALRTWKGAQGLAEDVRYYGQWMRDEAEKRIGHLYPKVVITSEMAKDRPDLNPYVGRRLTVIAWLWARTVKSPNPAFANVEVPLISTFMLSTKPHKEAYVALAMEPCGYRFVVKVGKPTDAAAARNGTRLGTGANFACVMSGAPIAPDFIKAEGQAGRLGARMMAIVAEGERGRVYLPPTADMETIAQSAVPGWKPEIEFFQQALGFRVGNYGMTKWSDLFTPRQLVALGTLSGLVADARSVVREHLRSARGATTTACDDVDAREDDVQNRSASRAPTGRDRDAYAEALAVYLSFGISRSADFWSSLCIWANQPKNELVTHLFGRQAIPMAWDFAEANPFSDSGGNFTRNLEYVARAVEQLPAAGLGLAEQDDATRGRTSGDRVVSTDPPYFDNVGYADLSDYFYVWLRRSQQHSFPQLFATVSTPKTEELVATPGRHGGKQGAGVFFLEGMTRVMRHLAEQVHPGFPITIYYAFKQTESDVDLGTSSNGWQVFLESVLASGLGVTGTWPVRTERPGRMRDTGSNALASSIVLVCRPQPADASTATRREFAAALKAELPAALTHLQRSNIAPVDLAQASIGPGMAVFTRYSQVVDASGNPMSVREALALINGTLDEALAEQDGDFDADTRFALAWFEQSSFAEGEFGVADVLARAKNTSVAGLVEAGILRAKGGRVRLLKPSELREDWDPTTDSRFTTWEAVHHLVRALGKGEQVAADLVRALEGKAEVARELAYRLYAVSERKKRAAEAQSYNGLVEIWRELALLSRTAARDGRQDLLFEEGKND